MAIIKYREQRPRAMVGGLPSFMSSSTAMGVGYDFNNGEWVTLANENLSLMPLKNVDVEMLHNSNNSNNANLELGGIYALEGGKIEGVDLGNSLYFRLHGIISEYKGIELNSLIMKEVCLNDEGKFEEGTSCIKRRKFSIPPSMCKIFGVEYEPGYELWSMDTNFVRVRETNHVDKMMSDLDYKDLSTYPTSSIDGTIRQLILELHNFALYGEDEIITPTGKTVKTTDLLKTMTILFKENIPTDNGCAGFREGDRLPFKVMTRPSKNGNTSICDDKHNIYVMVNLTKDSVNVMTPDGKIGVSHTAFDGKDIDDVISVKWMEPSSRRTPNDEQMQAVMNALDRHFGVGSKWSRLGFSVVDDLINSNVYSRRR